jgi:hypothetical protein
MSYCFGRRSMRMYKSDLSIMRSLELLYDGVQEKNVYVCFFMVVGSLETVNFIP